MGDRICPRCGGVGFYEVAVLKPVAKRLARRTRPRAKGGRRFKHAKRDPAKLEWVRDRERCVACRALFMAGVLATYPRAGECDPHHEPPRSRGGGDDQVCGLCSTHHESRTSRLNRRNFEALYGISFAEETTACEARYQAWRAAQAGAR